MHIYGTRNRKTSFEATDFLRSNDRMASLLPAALRMADLQRDVGQALPPMFGNCDVLSFQDGVLVLAVPSSAVAARLKQQLPKLQSGAAGKRGWQVTSIKLKVQVTRAMRAGGAHAPAGAAADGGRRLRGAGRYAGPIRRRMRRWWRRSRLAAKRRGG
jgi:hypothetical protein